MATVIGFYECCGKILEKDTETKSSDIFDPDRWQRTPHYICTDCIKNHEELIDSLTKEMEKAQT